MSLKYAFPSSKCTLTNKKLVFNDNKNFVICGERENLHIDFSIYFLTYQVYENFQPRKMKKTKKQTKKTH